MIMADLKCWKDGILIADDMACLLEKANFVPKASKDTKVTAEPRDIRQVMFELRAIGKYRLGDKTKFFNKTALVWNMQENAICQIAVSQIM